MFYMWRVRASYSDVTYQATTTTTNDGTSSTLGVERTVYTTVLLLLASLAHHQGQQYGDDQSQWAQLGQYNKYGQWGQYNGHQRYEALVALDIAKIRRDDVEQVDDQVCENYDVRPQQQDRMCATTTEEAIQDATVITSTIFIQSAYTLILFDSGRMHNFLAKAFVDKIGMRLNDLVYDLVVSTPARAVLTTRVCMRGIIIMIQWYTLLTNFVVLPMRELDAIFGTG